MPLVVVNELGNPGLPTQSWLRFFVGLAGVVWFPKVYAICYGDSLGTVLSVRLAEPENVIGFRGADLGRLWRIAVEVDTAVAGYPEVAFGIC